MEVTVIKFQFTSPLHIGTVREDYASSERMIHSDTLYAAIMHIWGMLGWEVPESPGFTLSSLFPFTTVSDNPVYFFPKPFIYPQNTAPKKEDIAKKVKAIKWLDIHYFEKYLKQESFSGYGTNNKDLQGNFASQYYLGQGFIHAEVFPRTKIPREYDDTIIYYIERISFTPGSGFYCILDCKSEEVKNNLHTALEILQHEGLGTDRSVGNGLFEISYDKLRVALPNSSGYMTNLSLFCPANKLSLDPTLDNKAKYELIKRGGYITHPDFSTIKKQEVYMFREGSVFKTESKSEWEIMGSTVYA